MDVFKKMGLDPNELAGKRIAISGSTGGLGIAVCRYLAELNTQLILMDRNQAKAEDHRRELTAAFPHIKIELIALDLADMDTVRAAVVRLKELSPHYIIHNAGAYSIPRYTCQTGYDNVFQINFVSPYYITRELMQTVIQNRGKIIAVGSIAHNYSKTDKEDTDFSKRTRASRVYGNAKRYLMFAHLELFKGNAADCLSVVHPGISFTGITAHYPKLIFALIKYPMKVIFMKPKKATLSILRGLSLSTEHTYWIGPKFFNVWGLPVKKRLKTCSNEESLYIFNEAEKIYKKLKTEK